MKESRPVLERREALTHAAEVGLRCLTEANGVNVSYPQWGQVFGRDRTVKMEM